MRDYCWWATRLATTIRSRVRASIAHCTARNWPLRSHWRRWRRTISAPRRLARYDQIYRETFKGKRLVEMIVQSAVQTPPLMDHLARILGRRKTMADTIVAVTGDFLPPSAVLRPGYLLRLVL